MGKKAVADKTYTNAKAYFQEKYQEKVMYQKAMARNMGYVNKTVELNKKLAEALMQIAEVQQADHEYVNSTTIANKKTMEAMMKIILGN